MLLECMLTCKHNGAVEKCQVPTSRAGPSPEERVRGSAVDFGRHECSVWRGILSAVALSIARDFACGLAGCVLILARGEHVSPLLPTKQR